MLKKLFSDIFINYLMMGKIVLEIFSNILKMLFFY